MLWVITQWTLTMHTWTSNQPWVYVCKLFHIHGNPGSESGAEFRKGSGEEFWPRGGVESRTVEVWDGVSPDTKSEFIKVDEVLDLDGDLAPIQRFVEIQNNVIRKSQRLQEQIHAVRLESQMLNETFNKVPVEQEHKDNDVRATLTSSGD